MTQHLTVVKHRVHYPEGHGSEPISEQYPDIFVCHACSDGLDEWVNCSRATHIDPIDTLRALADEQVRDSSWADRVVGVINSIEGASSRYEPPREVNREPL